MSQEFVGSSSYEPAGSTGSSRGALMRGALEKDARREESQSSATSWAEVDPRSTTRLPTRLVVARDNGKSAYRLLPSNNSRGDLEAQLAASAAGGPGNGGAAAPIYDEDDYDDDDGYDSDSGDAFGDDVEGIAASIGADPQVLYQKIREANSAASGQMQSSGANGGSTGSSSRLGNAPGSTAASTGTGGSNDDGTSRARLLEAVVARNAEQQGFGFSRPHLVEVEFEDEDPDNSAGAGSSEMRPSTHSMQSNSTQTTRTLFRLPKNVEEERSRKRRGVKFDTVVVQNVCVYEVDNTLYVAVEFHRHWLAWVLLFAGLMFDVIFQVHFTYFVVKITPNPTKPTLTLPAQVWVSMCLAFWCIVLLVCGAVTGVGTTPGLRFVKSLRGAALFTGMSIGYAGAMALIVITLHVTDRVDFYTTVNLHGLWILVFRLLTKEHVFFAEVIGVLFAISGFIISGVPTYGEDWDKKHTIDSVIANVLLFGASLCFAFHYLSLQSIRYKAPLTGLLVAPSVCSLLLSFVVAVSFGASIEGSSGIFAVFEGQYFMHCAIMALEHLLSLVSYFLAVRYLDILSVAVCFTLTTVLSPIGDHIIVSEFIPQQWGPTFFAGVAIVCVGSLFVVIFASVKRQFVARRLALERRKRVPHPYRKRKTESPLGSPRTKDAADSYK